MKNKIIPIFLLLAIGALAWANYILPLLNLFLHINYKSSLLSYFVIIATYLCIVLLMWAEKSNLEEFHIDRFSLAILVLFGFYRSNYNFPGEIYLQISIYLLSLVLLLTFIVNYPRIPRTQPHWILIGILACFLVIPLAYISSLKPEIISNSTFLAKGFLWNTARNTLFNLSFVSPYEEIIFRGILWGQLRRWGWTDKRIFWVQAILFWLMHFWEVYSRPFTFMTILPITILIESLLVFYSKKVSPSILFHTASNSLVALIVQFFLFSFFYPPFGQAYSSCNWNVRTTSIQRHDILIHL